jgi:hypothetical protein
MRHLIIIGIALALSSASVPAQTPSPAPPAATDDPSIHAYGDRDKACLAWTDKCRHCERGDNDQIVCSNIGIACQPAAITCTRRSEPAKDQPVAK